MLFRARAPRPITIALVALATVFAIVAAAPAASAATLTGVAFKDLDRSGTWAMTEELLPGQELYLFKDGTYVTGATTDSSGRYTMAGLQDGDYRVEYAAPSWWALRDNWVPTTTGSLRAVRNVHVAGDTTADFGWRPIVRSTDPDAPISTYTGPSGLKVSSYDDAVTARELYDALALARLGEEASHVEVRFDLNGTSVTAASVAEADGVYSNYTARSFVSYDSWLDSGDRTLTHEYGHAWSLYYAYMVQRDPNLTSYLQARGLAGDTRVGSSYAWSPREMIAEDYRQLFGSANARSGGQINGEIPPAAQVPGLADFLTNAFVTPASPPPPPPPPPPPAAPKLSSLAMNPDPVKTTATAGFTLSASGTVTLRVLTSGGALVRTLVAGIAKPAGAVQASWDRLDAKGRRVGRGTYRLQADVVDSVGQTATSSATFAVA
ncbi:MAG: hypothetical protein QOJ89_2652 [bacterium]